MNLLYLDQNIISLLGLDNLPVEKKQQLLDQINEVVGQRVMFRVMDELSETDKTALDTLLDQKASQEEIDKFLNDKLDLKAIIVEEANQFKELLSQDVSILKDLVK